MRPLLCFILLPFLVWSQVASNLSPRVRLFVREDAPKIALAQVRVIDGTDAAAPRLATFRELFH
jgi:hypothetical protein